MRKIMLMASMLAMVLLAASPVMAQSQEANQSNAQAGAVDGSGSVVNNAANIVQQCQSGDQYQYGGEGNIQVSSFQCQQILNLVQAGEDAEQAVEQVIGQNQDTTGVQYGDDTTGAPQAPADDEAPVDEADEVVVDEEVVDEVDVNEVDKVVALVDANEDGVVDVDEAEAVDSQATADAIASASAFASADAEAAAVASADAAAEADSDAVAVLPDTGGASLFTLGAGALLVAGGLLARRIVR